MQKNFPDCTKFGTEETAEVAYYSNTVVYYYIYLYYQKLLNNSYKLLIREQAMPNSNI